MTNVVAFRCSVKAPIGRAGERTSAVASASYNAREKLHDDEHNKTFDFSKGHSEVLFKGIFAPENAPDWARDREQLWNNVQSYEDRKNSQFARPLEIALPHELSDKQREFIVKDWVRENFQRAGMVADVAIHEPDKDGNNKNYHAHILLTLRGMDENGFTGNKVREWNSKESLTAWREDLAHKCGKMLERAGHELEGERWRNGHLTLPEQFNKALERNDFDYAEACIKDPSKHRGPELTALEREGVEISPLRDNPAERERLDNLQTIQRATLALARERYELERAAERQPEPEKTPEPERLDERRSFSGFEYGLMNNIQERLEQSPAEFVAGLQASGLHLARATADDCKAILEDAFRPDGLNMAALKIKEGDLCTVTNSGKIFALPLLGADKEKVSAAWLAGHEIERADMQTVGEVRQDVAEAQQERAEAREQQEIDWQNIREERADQIERDIISDETRADDREAAHSLENVGGEIADGIGGVANVIAKLSEKTLTFATEGIANMFGATPAPKELLRDIADRKQWAREEAAEREKQAEVSERSAEAGKNSQEEKQREEWREFEERTRRNDGYDRDRER